MGSGPPLATHAVKASGKRGWTRLKPCLRHFCHAMSIYRRSDRVPLSDVAATPQPRRDGAQPQNDVEWTTQRAKEPAMGLLRPTAHWASALPRDVVPHALLSRFPRICNLLAVLWQDPNSL